MDANSGGARTLGLPFAAAIHDEAGNTRGVLDTELSLAELSAFLRQLDLDTPLRPNQASELVELSQEFNNMTAGLRDRVLLRKSLARASEVQQGLLPSADPKLEGFGIVGHCNYCDETGGDYYDDLSDGETSERGTAAVIGDVMGHGIAAAMLIATDGMWETRNTADQMHGKDRLQDSIRRHAQKPAKDIRDGLLHDLHTFRGQHPQDDDQTFVVIKVVN